MNTKTHPIGVMPRWLHDEKRLDEVRSAILRYVGVNQPLPEEWVEEYNELCKSIRERKAKREEKSND
jgi:hypothetical protein